MASLKVSEFAAAAALDGTELVGLVQGGENVQSTVDDLGSFAVDNVYTITEVDNLLSTVGSPPIPHGLVSGGQVTWDSGLTFRVSAAEYYIDGTFFTSAEATVTLGAADATNTRIDVIALDATGPIVIAGTAAASPSKPQIDALSQIELSFVTVDATDTEPSGGVPDEDVYFEAVEWTDTTSGVGWNTTSATDPKSGSVSIEGTDVAAGAYVLLEAPGARTPGDWENLRLFIKSKAAWARKRSLRIQLFNAGVAIGTAVTISDGRYGFDSTNTASYQQVAIPFIDFAASVDFNQIRLTGVGGAFGCFIDEIRLQGVSAGISNPNPTVEASNQEIWAGDISTKMITPLRLYTSAAEQALTDGVTITPDFDTGINFGVTLGGNRTLANPTNAKSGQSGLIIVTQDGTGGRTLTYGANWLFPGGDPTLSTAAGAIDVISYFVRPGGTLVCSIAKELS